MEILSTIPSIVWAILLRLLGIGITLVVGRWLANWSRHWLGRTLRKTDLTASLITLSTTAAYYGIWLVTLLTVLALLGVPVTAIVAVSGMILIVVGIALRESLSDLAATVIFVLFKPFEVGELIETNGKLGIVREIEMFNTVLLAPDNKVHILANSQVQNNGVTNYAKMGTLRVDLTVGISYGADILVARRIVQEAVAADERVLADPPMQVFVEELDDSSVNIAARPHVKSEDYLQFRRGILEPIKLQLEAAGITIPFPQRDVHMIAENDQKQQTKDEPTAKTENRP